MGDEYTYFLCFGHLGVTTSHWPVSAYVVEQGNARTIAILFTHANIVNIVSEVVHMDRTTLVEMKHTVKPPTTTHINDSSCYRAVPACSSLLDWAANRTRGWNAHASPQPVPISCLQQGHEHLYSAAGRNMFIT